ncbi:MAG: hypothetical protein ACFE8L_14515 [Candidatus Hodarchaeota archaeon]
MNDAQSVKRLRILVIIFPIIGAILIALGVPTLIYGGSYYYTTRGVWLYTGIALLVMGCILLIIATPIVAAKRNKKIKDLQKK